MRQEEACNFLAIIFETAREQMDVAAIRRGLYFSERQNIGEFEDYWKATFHFFVANGWSYLQRLTQPINGTEFWAFESSEIEQQVIHLRKAETASAKLNDPILRAQILTNLGNIFSHIGRFIEPTQYWQKAIQVRPDFGLAVGNLGFGLMHYAKVLFDEGHRFLFCKFAYNHLKSGSTSEDVYEEARTEFANSRISLKVGTGLLN